MPASKAAQEHAVARAAKIFTVLKQCAAAKLACPTNAALGERFGCGSNPIASALTFLEANGMIEVERMNDARVVTICASGEKTAAPFRLRTLPSKRRAA